MENCIICLDEINSDQHITILKCSHIYHHECFLKYILYGLNKIKQNNIIQCPLCRTCIKSIFYIDYLYYKQLDLIKDTKLLKRKKHKLQNKIYILNMKQYFLWRLKPNNDFSKEENIMYDIETLNKQIRQNEYMSKNIRKVYHNLAK